MDLRKLIIIIVGIIMKHSDMVVSMNDIWPVPQLSNPKNKYIKSD